MKPPAAVDAALCPLCGQPNRCAMEVEKETGRAQPPCWCLHMDFSADLLARVPADRQRMACICAACAAPAPPRP